VALHRQPEGGTFFETENMKAIEIEKHYPEGRLVIRPYQDGSQYHLLTVDIPRDWQIYDDDLKKMNPGALGMRVSGGLGAWVFGKPEEYETMVRELHRYDGELVPTSVLLENEMISRIFRECVELGFSMVDFIRSRIFKYWQYQIRIEQAPVPDFLMDGFHYEKGSPVGAFRCQLSDKQMEIFEMGSRKLNLSFTDYAVACVMGLARSGVECGRVRWPKDLAISFTTMIDANIMNIVQKAAGKMPYQEWCQGVIVDMLEGMGVEA
jgi:hypothetical protein